MAERFGKLLGHLRSLCYGTYAWLVFSALLLVFAVGAPFVGRRRARPFARFCARAIFRLAGMPVSAVGLERLPTQTHVLVVNHCSFLDPILLTALLPASPGYAFTTRQQYRMQALLWPILHSVGALVLRPHAESHHTVNVGILKSALARGENLIVFPEGGFKREPGLRHFHRGAFVAAAETGVPVAVAGLRGTRTALPVFSWLPKRRPLTLEIGPILPAHGRDVDAQALADAARDAMRPLAGEDEIDGEDERRN